jgi:hypothetical protein
MLAKNFDEIRRTTQLSEAKVVQKLEDFKSIDKIVLGNLKEQEDQIFQKLRERKRDSFIKGVSRSDDSYRKRHSALPGSFNFKGLLMDTNISTFDGLPTTGDPCSLNVLEEIRPEDSAN